MDDFDKEPVKSKYEITPWLRNIPVIQSDILQRLADIQHANENGSNRAYFNLKESVEKFTPEEIDQLEAEVEKAKKIKGLESLIDAVKKQDVYAMGGIFITIQHFARSSQEALEGADVIILNQARFIEDYSELFLKDIYSIETDDELNFYKFEFYLLLGGVSDAAVKKAIEHSVSKKLKKLHKFLLDYFGLRNQWSPDIFTNAPESSVTKAEGKETGYWQMQNAKWFKLTFFESQNYPIGRIMEQPANGIYKFFENKMYYPIGNHRLFSHCKHNPGKLPTLLRTDNLGRLEVLVFSMSDENVAQIVDIAISNENCLEIKFSDNTTCLCHKRRTGGYSVLSLSNQEYFEPLRIKNKRVIEPGLVELQFKNKPNLYMSLMGGEGLKIFRSTRFDSSIYHQDDPPFTQISKLCDGLYELSSADCKTKVLISLNLDRVWDIVDPRQHIHTINKLSENIYMCFRVSVFGSNEINNIDILTKSQVGLWEFFETQYVGQRFTEYSMLNNSTLKLFNNDFERVFFLDDYTTIVPLCTPDDVTLFKSITQIWDNFFLAKIRKKDLMESSNREEDSELVDQGHAAKGSKNDEEYCECLLIRNEDGSIEYYKDQNGIHKFQKINVESENGEKKLVIQHTIENNGGIFEVDYDSILESFSKTVE